MYPVKINVLSKNIKNIEIFPRIFQLIQLKKNLCILHGQVFVMRLKNAQVKAYFDCYLLSIIFMNGPLYSITLLNFTFDKLFDHLKIFFNSQNLNVLNSQGNLYRMLLLPEFSISGTVIW